MMPFAFAVIVSGNRPTAASKQLGTGRAASATDLQTPSKPQPGRG